MTSTPNWPHTAWAAIEDADTGLHRLNVTLDGLRAACSTAAAALTPTPEFHPAAGWLTADGLLALLELTRISDPIGETFVDEPPDAQTAAQAVDQLLRHAADLGHTLAASYTASGDGERARVMAEVVKQLALGHKLTFGRPW